jgi:hypothetical protein
MCSRILAIVLSLVFLLSGVVSAGPAMAADLPAGDSADHDQSGSPLDIPDQLEGPQAPRSIAAQAFRPDAQRTVSLTDPHLAGPQRPPRASALPA